MAQANSALKDAQKYAERFPGSAYLKGLASQHYLLSHAARYWGSNGAIFIAEMMVDEMRLTRSEFPKEKFNHTSKLLMLSTYYSASASALSLWKRRKVGIVYFVRAVVNLLQAKWFAKKLVSTFDGSADLVKSLTLSEIEVFISPDWAIATRGARLSWLVRKNKNRVLCIGRKALKQHSNDEGSMAYALLAGKMMQLLLICGERVRLEFIVTTAAEKTSGYHAKDRARLWNLLGHHEKARVLGEEAGSWDVVQKSIP